jgi:hypothetical protein
MYFTAFIYILWNSWNTILFTVRNYFNYSDGRQSDGEGVDRSGLDKWIRQLFLYSG